jgi:hypothetical protein
MRVLFEKPPAGISIHHYAKFFIKNCGESVIKDNPVLSELSRRRIFGLSAGILNSIFTVTQNELTAEEKQHFENYVAACNALGLEQHYGELVAITIELKGEK